MDVCSWNKRDPGDWKLNTTVDTWQVWQSYNDQCTNKENPRKNALLLVRQKDRSMMFKWSNS